MLDVSRPPAAPSPSSPRPRRGGIGARLLVSLGVLAGAAAAVVTVAVLQGWIVIEPPGRQLVAGSATPVVNAAGLASAPAAAAPLAAGGEVAPEPPPSDAAVGNVTLDPAYAGGTSGASAAISGEEAAALRAAMIVPVRGVPRGALREDFAQARGDGERRHNALDIPAPRGTPVVAATDGRVLKLFDSEDGGLTVYAAEPSGRFVMMYGHLDRYAPGLREGATVRRGDPIGTVGSSGNASDAVPHLHFTVSRARTPGEWNGGAPINPFPLLRP